MRSTLSILLRLAPALALTVGLLAAAPTASAAPERSPQGPAQVARERAAQPATARKHKPRKKKHQSKHRNGRSAMASRALRIAAAQTGDPYSYGASGPGSFDCSGLTSYAYRKAGFRAIPRTSSAQAGFAKRISRAGMRRGDLVFFSGGGGVYHVGVYAGVHHGRRTVIHAPYSGTRVRREPIWTDGWFPGTLRFR